MSSIKPGRQNSISPGMNTVLSFDNISYDVTIKQNPCSKGTKKRIINGVSGIFKPGLNAILGATGSGKTSLLDILAMKKDPAGLDGHILANGKPMSNNFRLMTGYVPQDDIVLGTLTVRENIWFSANLRLPKTYSNQQKKEMVDDVIEELGLSHVADSKVGNAVIRGISGGERKRTCIGIELVIAPRVLYLDEPTTGLDSTTASSVISLLHKLSRRGRTIIFSIHQPRYSIFKLFDRMMLLARGRVMYHGPSADALTYFGTTGYQCEMHDNPADFFLDIINGDVGPHEGDPAVTYVNKSEEVTSFSNSAFVHEEDEITGKKNGMNSNQVVPQISVISNLSEAVDDSVKPNHQPGFDIMELVKKNERLFMESHWHTLMRSELDPITESFNRNKSQFVKELSKKENRIAYNVLFLKQLGVLAKRTVLNLWRNPFASFMQLGVIIFFAFFVGMIYFDLEPSLETGIQNRSGAFFFMTMNQVFMNMSALELFLNERLMFMHENATGFYRVSVYFFCKLIFDVIPMRIIPVCIFSTITFFMIDLRFTVFKFVVFTLNLCLTSTSAASICFMYSSIFDIYAVANLCSALTFIFMLVFGGFIINLEDIWEGLRWIKHVSIFRYSINTMSVLELEDICLTGNGTVNCDAGNNYLDTNSIDYGTAWDIWQNIMGLILIAMGGFIITYIRLRTINKYK